MAKQKPKPRPPRRRPRATKCPFCEKRGQPDYKNDEELTYFLTSRARILPRSVSGLCRKHQRALKKGVKRARFLALLSFTPRAE